MIGLMRSWNRFIQVSISGGNSILGPRVRPPGTRCQFQRDRADYWGEGCRDRFLHPDQGIHANAMVTDTRYKIQGTEFWEKNSLSIPWVSGVKKSTSCGVTAKTNCPRYEPWLRVCLHCSLRRAETHLWPTSSLHQPHRLEKVRRHASKQVQGSFQQ